MKENLVIILVNYNGFADTRSCLKSIVKVKGGLPFVILVDNASSEKADLKNLKSLYRKLKLICNTENVGFGRANNIGIRWAQENIDFDYLLLLNNDTLVEPTTFHYLMEAFRKDNKIGIVTGKTMYETNRDIVWYGGGNISYKRGRPIIADYNQRPTEKGANRGKYVNFVSGCVMMFTKKSISQLKGFDDDFFMYCEDLELSMRAQNMGYKMYYEPRSVIFHKVQASVKKTANEVIGLKPSNPNLEFLFYNMKSNQYLAMKKNCSHRNFLVFNLFYWMEFLFINLRMLRAKRFDIFFISNKTIKRILRF